MPSSSAASIEMHKFPKIKYPNDSETAGLLAEKCIVTEKLDGANFRFTWTEGGELVFGSRNVKFTEHGEPLPDEEVNQDFQHAVESTRKLLASATDFPDEPWRYTFFGESMQLHSLQYEDIDYTAPTSGPPYPANLRNSVILFDAWDHQEEEWVHWDTFTELAGGLNIDTTMELAMGNEDFLRENDRLEIPDESMFGGPPEGIVVRQLSGNVRAKKVSEDFKEKNAVAFNSPSKAESDAAEFVAMFVTPGRIKNVAHSLVEEGGYDTLEMPMMEDLPREVIKDIFEEESWNLMCNEYNYEAELDDEWKSEVRSRTSKLCARHLKQEVNKF